jgi:hypothetical protein
VLLFAIAIDADVDNVLFACVALPCLALSAAFALKAIVLDTVYVDWQAGRQAGLSAALQYGSRVGDPQPHHVSLLSSASSEVPPSSPHLICSFIILSIPSLSPHLHRSTLLDRAKQNDAPFLRLSLCHTR